MQSDIRMVRENGKDLYLVQPNSFLDLYFIGNRLIKAYNRKTDKWYKGKKLDVFTDDYDLFNKYYRQALADLMRLRNDPRYGLKDRLDKIRYEPVKRVADTPKGRVGYTGGYVCISNGNVIAERSSLALARRTAMEHIGRSIRTVEIWKNGMYVGTVHVLEGVFVFRTQTSVKVLKRDGTLF